MVQTLNDETVMKEINEMTKQEVIDEITTLENTLGLLKADMQDDEKYEQCYESFIDRLYDLDYAKTHNFPELI